MDRRLRIRLTVLIVLFMLFAFYTVMWTRSVMGPMSDFWIFFEAATKAVRGESAYFPYEVGISFLYHPSALSFLSIVARLPLEVANIVWSAFSLAAYVVTVFLGFCFFDSTEPSQRSPAQLHRYAAVLFALFAPLVENMYLGQINTFVALCLVVCLLCDERNNALGAGIALALAIILKTTPALLLAFFLATRRYRVIAATIVAFVVISVLTLVQFGPQVYTDFISVSFNITGGRLGLDDHFNFTAAGISYRILAALTLSVPSGMLIWIWRVIFGILFVLLMVRAARVGSSEARRWVFAASIVIMTVISPLVWNAHGVLLLFPLILVIRRDFFVGVMLMLLMQAEHLLYNSLSVAVGTIAITALPLVLAFTAGTATLMGQLGLFYQCWVNTTSSLLRPKL